MIPSVRYWKNDDSAVLRNKPIFSPRGVSASEWILFFRLCFVGVVTRPTQTRFVCLDLLEAVVMRRVDSLVYLDILERLQLERLFFLESCTFLYKIRDDFPSIILVKQADDYRCRLDHGWSVPSNWSSSDVELCSAESCAD